MLLHEAGPHDVQDSKKPAPARVLLVGDRLALRLDLVSEDVLRLLHDLPRGAGFDGICFRADILRQQIAAVSVKVAT